MAYRVDANTLPTLEPHATKDGILLCDAVFARDGVLTYLDPNTGKYRKEFRSPEENKKAVTQFGVVSVAHEHPSTPFSANPQARDRDQLRKGITLQAPTYEVVLGKGGFVRGQIAVLDASTQEAVKRGDCAELSAGYQCRIVEEPGEWSNPATGAVERYDARQVDIQVDHMALTRQGRAGPDVRVQGRFDAADETDFAYQVSEIPQRLDHQPPVNSMTQVQSPEPLAQVSLPGGVQMPVAVSAAQPLAMLAMRADSLDQQNQDLQAELTEATERADSLYQESERNSGRATALQEQVEALQARLDTADALLADLEIEFRGDGYYRVDGGATHKDMGDDHTDMDDDDDDDEDEFPFNQSKSKKSKKKDGNYKKDSVAPGLKALMQAITDAQGLGVDVRDRLDSITSPADVQRLVVAERFPKVDVEQRSDDAIAAMYEVIQGLPAEREDHTDELAGVVNSRRDSTANRNGIRAASQQKRMSAYKS